MNISRGKMAAVIPNNKPWQDFLRTYSELPILWKIESDDFKNKQKKNDAWNELLDVYRQIDEDATIEKLKNRINSLRTTYRREIKKIKKSRTLGNEYTPNIWYVPYLDFLKDIKEPEQSGISLSHLKGRPNSVKQPKRLTTVQLLRTATGVSSEGGRDQKDDASVFGAAWACSYRQLSGVQKLYAKKAIEDVLILAQLNQLTLNTVPISCPLLTQSTAASTAMSPNQLEEVQRARSNHEEMQRFHVNDCLEGSNSQSRRNLKRKFKTEFDDMEELQDSDTNASSPHPDDLGSFYDPAAQEENFIEISNVDSQQTARSLVYMEKYAFVDPLLAGLPKRKVDNLFFDFIPRIREAMEENERQNHNF